MPRKSKVKSENPAPYADALAPVPGVPDYLLSPHITETEYATIKAALAIVSRTGDKGPAFTTPDAAADFCKLQLTGLEREHFAVLFLDTRHHLIAYRALHLGTVDGSEVHPREVVKAALGFNASAVILTHNHPSGALEPSAADRVATKRLQEALRLVEVRVLDHIIVAGGGTASFARLGLL